MVLCACNDEKRFASEFTRENAGCKRIVATLRHPVEPLTSPRVLPSAFGAAFGHAKCRVCEAKKKSTQRVLSIVEIMKNS